MRRRTANHISWRQALVFLLLIASASPILARTSERTDPQRAPLRAQPLPQSDGRQNAAAGPGEAEDTGPNVRELTAIGNVLYFVQRTAAEGEELWRSDGMAAGTTLVKDIQPGPESSYPENLTAIGGVLYFGGNSGELWRSDGTNQGTWRVRASTWDSERQHGVFPITRLNGRIIVEVDGWSASPWYGTVEFWSTDGTSAGTEAFFSARYSPQFHPPYTRPILFDGTLYFGDSGGLHASDGTAAGTRLVKRLVLPYPAVFCCLTEAGGGLFFDATSAEAGAELWRSDGTEAGTVLVKDINPGTTSSTPTWLAAVQGMLYFVADDGVHGGEIWRSDGTEAGTVLVKDVNPGAGSSSPADLVAMDGRIYFRADDGIHGIELWRSDGTAEGTVLVKDVNPGAASSKPSVWRPGDFSSVGGALYFSADDGTSGTEPWRSDGTEAGTLRIADLAAGNASSYPGDFQLVGNRVVFAAEAETNRRELWRTNGVQGGATRVQSPAHVQPVWHNWFAVDTLETPLVGDFDGDGKTDLITFTRQNPAAVGDVYVALSDGTKFGDNMKWHDWFAITTDETVVIGNYDGDGKDDIATWLGKTTRQIYVARSLGTGMTPETVWLNGLGYDPTDVILSGDANGDGKSDLICFARTQGKVYVALSTGTGFQTPVQWHGFFAVSTYERPRVADVNGDGRADIVTFATDSPAAYGDVYVALSNGTRFVDQNGAPDSSTKWHDWFAIDPKEEVRVGDLDGDSQTDFFTFLPPSRGGQCYTVLSQGTSMGPNVLWRENIRFDDRDTVFVGDVNGDGKADVIVFAQGEGRVYVSLAQ